MFECPPRGAMRVGNHLLFGAGLVRLAREAAWASVAARAGLAGLCAFWLVKALQP